MRRFRRSRISARRRTFLVCLLVLVLGPKLHPSSPSHRLFPRLNREFRRWSFDWIEASHILQSESRYYAASEELHVHIISLSRDQERKSWTQLKLDEQGVPWNKFEAVDGLLGFSEGVIAKYAGPKRSRRIHVLSTVSHDVKLRIREVDPQLWDFKLKESLHERLRFGCYLSHVFLWQKIVSFREPFLTILEDDAEIVANFSYRTKSLLQLLPNSWDILYLDGCFKRYGPQFAPGLKISRGGLCTHGYVISFNAATRLLEGPVLRSEKPIDHLLDEEVLSGRLIAFHAVPPLVRVNSTLPSTLRYLDTNAPARAFL